LPFARGTFSLTCCSDAFHYVWPRRLLASEMMRATDAGGTLVLCHLHNALCDNPSPGMPLTPAGYRHLFRERQPALFRQSDVMNALVERRAAELSACSDADLTHEAALVLIAGAGSRDGASMRPFKAPSSSDLSLNPLYVRTNCSGAYELQFPSEFYAEEFADCRRYLPDRVELTTTAEGIMELASRHVLLELPARYL
jgi:hypothetical protein